MCVWVNPKLQLYPCLHLAFHIFLAMQQTLVPWPGIEPCPLHWKCSLTHWTSREVSAFSFVDYQYRIWDFLGSVYLVNYNHYFFWCAISHSFERTLFLVFFSQCFYITLCFESFLSVCQNRVSHAQSEPFLSETGNQPFL